MRNLPEITGMRGLAALYVVALHAVVSYVGLGPIPSSSSLLTAGWIGVDFFFVLSGFVLALPLLLAPQKMQAPGFWRTYAAKRWWRIAPSYYVSIVVGLALAGNLAYLHQNPLDVFLHLTFLHSIRLDSLVSIVPVYWTLAAEFQFYLLLPLFVILLRGRQWPWALCGLALTTLTWRALTYQGPGDDAWLSFTLPGFLLHFAVGILAARAYVANARSPLRAQVAVPAVIGLLIVWPLAVMGNGNVSQGDATWLANLLLRPLLAIGFATLIFIVASEASFFRRAFASRPLRVLGEQSYSLYLIHLPVLLVLVKVPFIDDIPFGSYVVLALTVSLLAGAFFFYLVERPALAVREWAVSRMKTPTKAPDAPLGHAPIALVSPAD